MYLKCHIELKMSLQDLVDAELMFSFLRNFNIWILFGAKFNFKIIYFTATVKFQFPYNVN